MSPHPDLEHSFGFLVADIARLLRERFNATAEQLGLTLAQTRVLARLSTHEGLNQSELAALLEVQPITLLRQIDRLEGMALVERRADPADRRVQRLHLTPKALPLLTQLVKLGEAMQDGWLDGIKAAERDHLYALLDQVRANLRAGRQALSSGSGAQQTTRPRTATPARPARRKV